MFYTGMRRNEVRGLLWEDVQPGFKMIILPAGTTKTKTRQFVRLTSDAIQLLKRQPQTKQTPYVFYNPKTLLPWDARWISYRFELVLKAVGIREKGICVHALRHSFISHLVMAGVDLRTVQELARHTDFQTTLRYSHLSPDIS